MQASEILRRYAAGDRNFQRMNLRGLSFKGQNLSGADFSRTDIRGTNFRGADLTEAKFRGAIAGLQARWVIIFWAIVGLLAALLGVCFVWVSLFAALIFESSPTSSVVIGWVSWIVLVVFFAIAIWKGVLAGVIAGVVMGVAAGNVMGVMMFAVDFDAGVEAAFVGVLAISVAGVVTIIGAVLGAIAIHEVLMGVIAGIIAGVIAIYGTAAIHGAVGEAIAGVVGGAVAGAFVLLGLYISQRAMKGDPRDTLIRNIAIAFATMRGTSFYKADLTDVDFSIALLESTDLREAILTRTCWKNTENLDRIQLDNTILENPQVRELLKTGNGYGKSFQNANLRGANLQGANLENANLKQADLSEAILCDANLKNTDLTEALAIGTDFTGAYLTGACLESWKISPSTILDRVDCQYVFLLEHPNTNNSRERHPHLPNKTFDPGDFEKLYKQSTNPGQFLLKNRTNHKAFHGTFQTIIETVQEALQTIIDENPEITWDSIQKIERKGEDVLVEIKVPKITDKAKIERTLDIAYESCMQKKYKDEM
ncbi:MAG: pentapeptide repeat-containing protein [Cyanobacteria bacterium P01_E01_bin.42]